MIQSLRLTLYDFFGYLLPGSIIALAVSIFMWAVYFPGKTFPVSPLSNQTWIVFAVFSYFAGHLIQALGNWLGKGIKPEESLFAKEAKPNDQALATAVRSTISSWGIETDKLDPKWLLQLCDETVAQTGVIADREIFVYREGFYRGTCGALLLLAVAMLVRLLKGSALLSFGDDVLCIPISMWLLFMLLSLVGSVMAFMRFKRFAQHRVNSAVAGFLVLQKDKTQRGKSDSDTPTEPS
jgi:hypothetical protein